MQNQPSAHARAHANTRVSTRARAPRARARARELGMNIAAMLDTMELTEIHNGARPTDRPSLDCCF